MTLPFDPEHTREHYDRYGEQEWDRWERTPGMRMQHAIFLHHLRARVRAGDRVLDAGCGAGRYTRELIAMGADVTALDLSPVQLALCRERAPGARDYVLGSVTELGACADESFDVTLALGGVLSYCFDQAPRAVSELVRVTKRGGTLGLSVMSLFGTIHHFLPGVLAIDAETNRRILETGDLPRDVSGHECHMFRTDELRSLLCALADVELFGPGWLTGPTATAIADERWEYLLEAEIAASGEAPGAGPHILAWGRRTDG